MKKKKSFGVHVGSYLRIKKVNGDVSVRKIIRETKHCWVTCNRILIKKDLSGAKGETVKDHLVIQHLPSTN